ncbi:MAG: hypothetical protein OQK35_05885 [Alphaproteobacteria bacterium]|nr:hypothetical protein [Alphaproteobacteria bacterium]
MSTPKKRILWLEDEHEAMKEFRGWLQDKFSDKAEIEVRSHPDDFTDWLSDDELTNFDPKDIIFIVDLSLNRVSRIKNWSQAEKMEEGTRIPANSIPGLWYVAYVLRDSSSKYFTTPVGILTQLWIEDPDLQNEIKCLPGQDTKQGKINIFAKAETGALEKIKIWLESVL